MEELCSTMLDAHVWDSQQNLDLLMADLIHFERFILHNDSIFDIAQKKQRIAYYVRLLFFFPSVFSLNNRKWALQRHHLYVSPNMAKLLDLALTTDDEFLFCSFAYVFHKWCSNKVC